MSLSQFLLHLSGTMNTNFMFMVFIMVAIPGAVLMVYLTRRPNRLSHVEAMADKDLKRAEQEQKHKEAMLRIDREIPRLAAGKSAATGQSKMIEHDEKEGHG